MENADCVVYEWVTLNNQDREYSFDLLQRDVNQEKEKKWFVNKTLITASVGYISGEIRRSRATPNKMEDEFFLYTHIDLVRCHCNGQMSLKKTISSIKHDPTKIDCNNQNQKLFKIPSSPPEIKESNEIIYTYSIRSECCWMDWSSYFVPLAGFLSFIGGLVSLHKILEIEKKLYRYNTIGEVERKIMTTNSKRCERSY